MRRAGRRSCPVSYTHLTVDTLARIQKVDKLTTLQGAERNQKCEVVAAAGEFQKVVRVGAVGVHEVEEKAAVRKFADKPQLSGVCGNALGLSLIHILVWKISLPVN